MRTPLILFPALALMSVGCTTVSDGFTAQHSAEGIAVVNVDLDSGAFHYQGARVSDFLVEGDSWGQASNPERATERQAGNVWSVDLGEGALWLDGSSSAGMAGVDFTVTGPASVDIRAQLDSGRVTLADTSGVVQIVADSIAVDGLWGSADLYARSGDIDAVITPTPGGVVRLEAFGDVDLTLPWGGDYDLQVWGDLDYAMWIDDLGFRWTTAAPGYFAGISGGGATRVDVFVTGGEVRIHSLW